MTIKKAFKEVLRFFNGDYEKALSWFATFNPLLGGFPIMMIIEGKTDKLCLFIKNLINGEHP